MTPPYFAHSEKQVSFCREKKKKICIARRQVLLAQYMFLAGCVLCIGRIQHMCFMLGKVVFLFSCHICLSCALVPLRYLHNRCYPKTYCQLVNTLAYVVTMFLLKDMLLARLQQTAHEEVCRQHTDCPDTIAATSASSSISTAHVMQAAKIIKFVNT